MDSQLIGDIKATLAHVRRGDVSESYARGMIDRGERWLTGLGSRRTSPGFHEEVVELELALADLREALAVKPDPLGVRLLYIPKRKSKTQAVLGRAETMANLVALQHAKARGIDPGPLHQPQVPTLPSIEVLRYDQGWVNRRGRARVEVAYELVIGGQRTLAGSKRYVMRQADWAAMCDSFGQLPVLETLTGLAKRRALYKARRDRRSAKAQKRRQHPTREHQPPDLCRLGGGGQGVNDDAGDGDSGRNR